MDDYCPCVHREGCYLVSYMGYNYVPVAKSRVISRKLMDFLLVSIVVRSLFFANMAHIFFFSNSTCRGVLWHAARPSSL